MDLSTFLGIIGAFGLMVLAIMTGGDFVIFINPRAMLIVLGGTLGAVLVHYPFKDVLNAFSVGKNAFFYKDSNPHQIIEKLIYFSNLARKEGLLSLEANINKVKNDQFFSKGLQMAADGQEPDNMRQILDKEITYTQERHESGADIFSALGLYAPAMGMIGTLIGLVQMLQTLDNPSNIGPAMAVALLTTMYGSILANVIFLPMAGKLKNRSQSEILKKTLIIEGIHSILIGENPRILEQKLHVFLAPKERKHSYSS